MATQAQPPPTRPHFESDGASLADTAVRDEGLSSFGALARFEFEAGRGNEGTKILMVEWDEEEAGSEAQAKETAHEKTTTSDPSSATSANWEVSWEGKRTVVSAHDGAEGPKHRLYFLLPPHTTIPPLVTITQIQAPTTTTTAGTAETESSTTPSSKPLRTLYANPLPAIFPAELGASARTAGKKGVLHTIWGKKRLGVLQREVEREREVNAEGVGLEMAVQEMRWIEENFGIPTGYASGGSGRGEGDGAGAPTPRSPTSPTGGGRLADKLKGLTLGTGKAELNSHTSPSTSREAHPLSPEGSDVAVSSFALFHGHGSSTSTSTSPPPTSARSNIPRAVAQSPPSAILAAQIQSGTGMASLNAVAGVEAPFPEQSGRGMSGAAQEPEEDDLFAVMVSPRSPDMRRSPFSFSDVPEEG